MPATLTILPETISAAREEADYTDADGDLHAEFSITAVYRLDACEEGDEPDADALYRAAEEALRPFLAEAIRSVRPTAKFDGFCENVDSGANIESLGGDLCRITTYAGGIIFA